MTFLSVSLQLSSGSAFTVASSAENSQAAVSRSTWKMAATGVYTPPAVSAVDTLAGVSSRRSEGRFLGSIAVAALLLCASYAKTSSASKRTATTKSSRVARFALKVDGQVCAGLPAPVPTQPLSTNLAEVQVPTQVSAPLIDLKDAVVPVVEPIRAALPAQPAPQVFAPTPVVAAAQAEEHAPSSWAAPSLRSVSSVCRASRRVGGSRCALPRRSSSRVSRAATAAATAARRSVGSRLEARAPCPEVVQASYDASLLRSKIQVGIVAVGCVRSGCGRESKTPASKACVMSTGVLILANEFGQQDMSHKANNKSPNR